MFPIDAGIGVFDLTLRRVSIFSGDGQYLRDFSVEGRVRTIAGWAPGSGPVGVDDATPDGEPRAYTFLNADGTPARVVDGPIEPPTVIISYSPAEGRGGRMVVPCSPRIMQAVVGSTLFVVNSAANEVTTISPEGQQRVIYRSPRRPRATQSMIESIRSGMTASGLPGSAVAQIVQTFGEVGDSLATTWDAVVPDPTGRLWLRLAQCESGYSRWEVIDTSGAFIALAQLNRGLRAARGEFVVAVEGDQFDRLYANLHRLRTERR